MGSASVPAVFDVMVSTPAAFVSLNAANINFRYELFGLIVFDEVHHVMKRHPYRTIARNISLMTEPPRILGLSASLTYAMGPSRIQSAITGLCGELNLTGDCIFTVSNEELVLDG